MSCIEGYMENMNFEKLLFPVLSVLGALFVGGILFVVTGINPLEAYISLFGGALIGGENLSNTIIRTVPLLMISLALAIPFTGGIWNIGGPGQIRVGAVVATWLGITFVNLPSPIAILLAIIGCFIAAGAYAIIAGYLKTKFGVNIIVVTLMFNFFALYFLSYLLGGPWRSAAGVRYSPPVAESFHLPILVSGTRLHAGLLLAIICIPLVYLLLERSRFGFELEMMGYSSEAAEYAGINQTKNTLIAMFLSGGIIGLAGMGEILGLHHRLMQGFSAEYGFIAVLVAMVGKSKPVGVTLVAIFYGILTTGGYAMAQTMNISSAYAYIIQALIFLFLLISEKVFEV